MQTPEECEPQLMRRCEKIWIVGENWVLPGEIWLPNQGNFRGKKENTSGSRGVIKRSSENRGKSQKPIEKSSEIKKKTSKKLPLSRLPRGRKKNPPARGSL